MDDDGFLQLGNLCTEEEEAALSMFMPKQEQEGSRSLAGTQSFMSSCPHFENKIPVWACWRCVVLQK